MSGSTQSHYFILTLLDGINLLRVHVSSWALCQHPTAMWALMHAPLCVLHLHSKPCFGKFFPIQPCFLLQVVGIKCTLYHIPLLLSEKLSGALSGCCALHPAPSRSTFCSASTFWPCSGSCSYLSLWLKHSAPSKVVIVGKLKVLLHSHCCHISLFNSLY